MKLAEKEKKDKHKLMFDFVMENNKQLSDLVYSNKDENKKINFLRDFLISSEPIKKQFCGCNKHRSSFVGWYKKRKREHHTVREETFEQYMNGHYRYHIIRAYIENHPDEDVRWQLLGNQEYLISKYRSGDAVNISHHSTISHIENGEVYVYASNYNKQLEEEEMDECIGDFDLHNQAS